MKQLPLKAFLHLFFFCISLSCYAQNFHLKINGSNQSESQIIDSLNYSNNHSNIKSLFDEVKSTSEKLSKRGYLDNKIYETQKINDSTFISTIELKSKIKSIHIYIGTNSDFFFPSKVKNDTIVIPYQEIEGFLNQKIADAEKAGFALSKLKLENIHRKNLIIYADLNLKSEKKRTINSIVLNQTNDQKKDFSQKAT